MARIAAPRRCAVDPGFPACARFLRFAAAPLGVASVRGKKHTGYRPLRGSFSDAGEVGGNRLRFSGRLRGRKLRPGLYRLIALPVDAAGNTGNAVFVRFRIVR